jgi:hypothetical protein
MITNDVTLALINEALRTYPLPPGTKPEDRPRGVEKWPGTTFEMHYDAAQVLLGMYRRLECGYVLTGGIRFAEWSSRWLLSGATQTSVWQEQDDREGHGVSSGQGHDAVSAVLGH